MRRRPFFVVLILALTGIVIQGGRELALRLSRHPEGPVIHETTSAYSRIRVRERDGIRRLFFVDPQGRERQQSAIDLRAPERLQLAYSQSMFLSFLFQEQPERVLVVGRGGGGMVRFLQHARPEISLHAVEIDPVVVSIAETYFGTRAGPRTTIQTIDAFVYLAEPHAPYDVIYMDAFLKPPIDSGLDQLTLRLKTVEFLRQLRSQLSPEGIVVFNLIETDRSTPDDLAALREAFPQVYVFSVPRSWNLTVIATQSTSRLDHKAILARADAVERSGDLAEVPLRDLARLLRPER
jgi:spermidine synthase